MNEIAKLTHTSVARLIRRSVIEKYLLSDKETRLKAVKDLSEINGHVRDWPDIEKQIIEGALDDVL